MLRTDHILPWVKGPSVLDVGCTGHQIEVGSPYWLHGRLRDLFENVTGVDLSSENVERLRSLGFDSVYVQNAEELALPNKFDTIVAGEVLEHLSNPGRFLVKAKEHLKVGGNIVLTTPYAFSLLYMLYAMYKYPRTCENLEHACWFCVRTIHSLAERAGLKVVHFELVEDYRPDSPSPLYSTFVKGIAFLRPFLPSRLRCNAMLVVLSRADES